MNNSVNDQSVHASSFQPTTARNRLKKGLTIIHDLTLLCIPMIAGLIQYAFMARNSVRYWRAFKYFLKLCNFQWSSKIINLPDTILCYTSYYVWDIICVRNMKLTETYMAYIFNSITAFCLKTTNFLKLFVFNHSRCGCGLLKVYALYVLPGADAIVTRLSNRFK